MIDDGRTLEVSGATSRARERALSGGRNVNILAIETATTACAIALRASEGERDRAHPRHDRHHTEIADARDSRRPRPPLAWLQRHSIASSSIAAPVSTRGCASASRRRSVSASRPDAALVSVYVARSSWPQAPIVAACADRCSAAVDGRRGEVFVQSFHLGDDVSAQRRAGGRRRPTVIVEQWSRRDDAVTFGG